MENTYRALIRVVVADRHRIGFVIPCWDGGKKRFYSQLPPALYGKVSVFDRMFVRTQIGSDSYKTMTFEDWEYPKQMTSKELDEFYEKLIRKSK